MGGFASGLSISSTLIKTWISEKMMNSRKVTPCAKKRPISLRARFSKLAHGSLMRNGSPEGISDTELRRWVESVNGKQHSPLSDQLMSTVSESHRLQAAPYSALKEYVLYDKDHYTQK